MRIRLLPLLVLLLGLVPPLHAQWRTVDTPTIKGAYDLIVIPENWNGGLFIYAHGYSADARLLKPFPADLSLANFTSKLDLLFQATVLPSLSGYAVATTTFRSVGWYVKDSVKDIENLRRYFVKKYGAPGRTYLWGHSGGGMVTSTVIEYFPDTYDGALSMCGPTAGARRNFDGALDLRLAYEYVCGGVPGAQFACRVCSGGKARCLVDGDCPGTETCGAAEPVAPPEDGLSPACTKFLLDHPDRFSENPTSPGGGFVGGPVTTCFGDPSSATPPSTEQAARRDLFLRATQIPESFITTDMFFGTIGMGEVVHRRTRGKHPWGNEGVTYASPLLSGPERDALNAGIHRVREDAAGVKYLRAWYEPRGRTRTKVLTLHALNDGLVIPENQHKYAEIFAAAGRSDQLVQLFTSTGGHCGFVSELLPAIPALTGWVEEGVKPTFASVSAACPGCSLTDTAPGPWGSKVVERRQKGAPLRTLVCAEGVAGDCPDGSSCGGDLHCSRRASR